MAYNYNPTDRTRNWSPVYGGNVGAIDLPDPLADLADVNSQIKPQLDRAYGAIGNQIAGTLDPTTIAQLEDEAARWGLAAGTPAAPGSLGAARGFWNNVRTREQQKQLGLQNYGNLTGLVDQTMTLDPALQAQIADRNAMFNAAPVPSSANAQARADFNANLIRTMGLSGGGGGGGGTRVTWGDPSLPNLSAAGLGGTLGGYRDINAGGITVGTGTRDYGTAPSVTPTRTTKPATTTAPSWTTAGGGGGAPSWTAAGGAYNAGTQATAPGRNAGSMASYIGSVLGGLGGGGAANFATVSPHVTSGVGAGYYDTPVTGPNYVEDNYGNAPVGGGLGAVDNTIDVGWGNIWDFPTEPPNYVEDPWLDSIYGG